MKSEISEIQRLNERLSRQAEQARKRAKIAAGPRARCSIEKGPPSGNHQITDRWLSSSKLQPSR